MTTEEFRSIVTLWDKHQEALADISSARKHAHYVEQKLQDEMYAVGVVELSLDPKRTWVKDGRVIIAWRDNSGELKVEVCTVEELRGKSCCPHPG